MSVKGSIVQSHASEHFFFFLIDHRIRILGMSLYETFVKYYLVNTHSLNFSRLIYSRIVATSCPVFGSTLIALATNVTKINTDMVCHGYVRPQSECFK